MPNLKYLNINGVNYSLGRDTKVYYGSTSDTITDLLIGDLLIDSTSGTTYRYNGSTWVLIVTSGGSGASNLVDANASGAVRGINTVQEDGTYLVGQNAVAIGNNTQASGINSFTSGIGTVSQRGSQTVLGEYNILDTTGTSATKGDYVFILGNGIDDSHRSNAMTVDWTGSIDTQGAITAGSIDNSYGLNDEALLSSNTIALWEDIIYE